MIGDVYLRSFKVIFGGHLGLFENVFRIFIYGRVISESATDSGQKNSLREVYSSQSMSHIIYYFS